MKRKLKWFALILFTLVAVLFAAGIWSASGQLLFPVWRGVTKDLSVCGSEAEKHWGKGCGNLRTTQEFKFSEVRLNAGAYELPGWSVESAVNGMGPAQGAILLVHGGGSDRRELTHHIGFFLKRKLDVLTFDLACHGEAPCLVPGLTYGQRESRDVIAAYKYLATKYEKIYALGSSAGASAVLIALPEMPKLAAAIVENPPYSFERLIRETPAAPKGIPPWFTNLLIRLTLWRGNFDGSQSAANTLPHVKSAAIFFIQSKPDNVVPWQHTQELADLYYGEKKIWLPDYGNHGAIWDANRSEYGKQLADFLTHVK